MSEKPGASTDADRRAHRARLNTRLRAEWIAGAEEEWQRRTGQPMTTDELTRLLWRYPGDV